jgi:hypothetical protein
VTLEVFTADLENGGNPVCNQECNESLLVSVGSIGDGDHERTLGLEEIGRVRDLNLLSIVESLLFGDSQTHMQWPIGMVDELDSTSEVIERPEDTSYALVVRPIVKPVEDGTGSPLCPFGPGALSSSICSGVVGPTLAFRESTARFVGPG